MFCKKCGSKLFGDEDVCPYCGEPIEKKEEDITSKRLSLLDENKSAKEEIQSINKEYSFSQMSEEKPQDAGSIWCIILGFFVPIAGLILFCVWRTEKPKSAKQAGIAALISFICNIFLVFIFVCCVIMTGSSY